jgi:hypothetical protein
LALSTLPTLQAIVLVEDEYDNNGTLITYRPGEYQVRAMEYRDDYCSVYESMKRATLYRLEYMDRGGNSYLGIYVPHRMTDAGGMTGQIL